MIYLLYGQPGTGKSTLATGIALDYMRQGRRVAANFPIDPAPAATRRKGKINDAAPVVLPSRPSFASIRALGFGWHEPEKHAGREDLAGLLVIDEAGPWLDSRRWQDKDRAAIIDWMLQSRKRGWDLVLIAQAPALIDKQVREAVIEGYCRIRRTDRMKILGVFRLPRVHVGIVRYGLDTNSPVLERFVYRGKLEHKCFASYALFEAEQENGVYSVLPPRITKWAALDAERASRSVKRRLPQPRPKLPHIERLMQLPPEQRVAALRALQAVRPGISPLPAQS